MVFNNTVNGYNYTTQVMTEWVWSIGAIILMGKLKHSKETAWHSTSLFTIYPTCTALGLNPGRHGGRPEPTTWGMAQPINTRSFTSWSFCTWDMMHWISYVAAPVCKTVLQNSHNSCYYVKTHTSISSVLMVEHCNINCPIILTGKSDKLTELCGLSATQLFAPMI